MCVSDLSDGSGSGGRARGGGGVVVGFSTGWFGIPIPCATCFLTCSMFSEYGDSKTIEMPPGRLTHSGGMHE